MMTHATQALKLARKWRTAAMVGALCAAAAALCSCNIVGPAAYLLEGPPTVDAEYKLADVPTLVFIDDRHNVVNPVSLRRVIADKVSQDLMEQKIVKTTISPQDALALAAQRERNSKIISIEEIGNAMGARQVIYVEMVQFQDTPDGFTPRPTATCRVKVIDLDKHQRVYPGPDAQEPSRLVQTMTREVDPGQYSLRSGRLKIFEALAVDVGTSVGQLFYKHEARPLGGNLKPK